MTIPARARFLAFLLATMFVLAVPAAAQAIPSRVFDKKYKVVKVVGSQTYTYDFTDDTGHFWGTESMPFTLKRATLIDDLALDVPLTGTASGSYHGVLTPGGPQDCVDTLSLETIEAKLRLFLSPKTRRLVEYAPTFLYNQQGTELCGNTPMNLLDYSRPLFECTAPFNCRTYVYARFRANTVIMKLSGSKPGIFTTSGIGTDSYTYSLTVTMKRTNRKTTN